MKQGQKRDVCAQAHAAGFMLQQAALLQARGWGAAGSWSTLCRLLNVPQPTDTAQITRPGKKIKVSWKESSSTRGNLRQELDASWSNAKCVCGACGRQQPLGEHPSPSQQKFGQLIAEPDGNLDASVLLVQVEAGAGWSRGVIDAAPCFIFISCDGEVGGWRLLEVPG